MVSSLSSTKQISKACPASAAVTRSTRGWTLFASLRVGNHHADDGRGPARPFGSHGQRIGAKRARGAHRHGSSRGRWSAKPSERSDVGGDEQRDEQEQEHGVREQRQRDRDVRVTSKTACTASVVRKRNQTSSGSVSHATTDCATLPAPASASITESDAVRDPGDEGEPAHREVLTPAPGTRREARARVDDQRRGAPSRRGRAAAAPATPPLRRARRWSIWLASSPSSSATTPLPSTATNPSGGVGDARQCRERASRAHQNPDHRHGHTVEHGRHDRPGCRQGATIECMKCRRAVLSALGWRASAVLLASCAAARAGDVRRPRRGCVTQSEATQIWTSDQRPPRRHRARPAPHRASRP